MPERPEGWEPPPCLCGDPECRWNRAGAPYCRGCGEHHPPPVATAEEGAVCPVDEFMREE